MIKKIFDKENIGITPLKGLLRILGIFVIVLVVFLIILSISWSIPNSIIETNYESSMEIIEDEGSSWNRMFTYASGSTVDIFTDRIIILTSMAQDDRATPLYNALSAGGYSRYWHGYTAIIRPLFLLISYADIRYILMLVFAILALIIINGINKRLSTPVTYTFVIGLALTYFNIIPFCMQFSGIYLIMMISMAILLYRYKSDWNVNKVCEVFLIIGMVTQFLDLLTAPLLTLGMPLSVILLINIKELGTKSKLRNWTTLILSSITWAFGWAAGWCSKWIIGSLILKTNLIEEALGTAVFRVNGNEVGNASRIKALGKNIYSMMPFSNVIGKGEMAAAGVIGVIALGVIIAMIVYIVNHNMGKQYFACYIPVIALGLLPYVWYILIAQHSQIHYFFTYRIQMITCFAWLATYIGMIKNHNSEC